MMSASTFVASMIASIVHGVCYMLYKLSHICHYHAQSFHLLKEVTHVMFISASIVKLMISNLVDGNPHLLMLPMYIPKHHITLRVNIVLMYHFNQDVVKSCSHSSVVILRMGLLSG